MQKILASATALACVLLAACSADGVPDIAGGGSGANPTPSCSNPSAPSATQGSLVIDTPSDIDATTNPTPSTEIFYTVLTPARCPGDRFPLILHSHGYGGTRVRELAANGDLPTTLPHFGAIDALTQALPYHGYVVLSFDERGHGQSNASNARLIDPGRETQDARALLDWAYDNAERFGIQRETGTGIARDLKVGTLGNSYGGGFQMPLAALDARIDTIVPNGTWHGLLYSLLPGDSVKLGFAGLLGVLATLGNTSNTPVLQTLVNAVGFASPQAFNIRSRTDLFNAGTRPNARPRPVTEEEALLLFDRGMSYFRAQQQAGQGWGFGEPRARLRAVPALFLQGNRDVLFNLTEGYWNQRYFSEAGGDVRLLSTEGGHMNPLANQTEGTADCGSVVGITAVLGWFDHHLKGVDGDAYRNLPRLCISVADSRGAPDVAAAGLEMDHFPVGSLSGTGAVPTRLDSGTVSVSAQAIAPVFLPVATISGNDQVLAGVPTLARIVIERGAPALPNQSTNGFVGVGIVRDGETILVDDQVTAFTEGEHVNNRNIAQDDRILLPAVGERLRDGDQVGLLFYPQNVQYGAIASAQGVAGLTGIIRFATGAPVPPITSALEPVLGLLYLNPYSASVSDVQLPILVPGRYAGSRLNTP